ncbi:MAG: cation:proton antiporter, partial [Rubricoccaceae bacterium]|nr:cation:proton antiporter [Rubricoccaceae bacterium]
MSVPLLALAFAVVCLASYQIGRYASAIRLPYITGYLFAGVLVGSFGLGLIPSERAPDLRFVDELALAVIAFVAGSELSLPELRRRLRPILLSTGGILVVALTLLAGTLFVLTAALPFAQGWGVAARVATALLGATILLALSPPSTIAVIKEVRASGPFTRTALSVTVFMDVVIIVLFAVSASVASALLLDVALNLGFVGLLAAELATAVGLGLAAGQLLRGLLATRLPRLAKTAFVLVAGFGIYELARWVKMTTLAAWGTEFYIEPLLIAMIAGFVVANFTRHRDEFEAILHDVGPAVYVAFFTLTGLTLKLDLL